MGYLEQVGSGTYHHHNNNAIVGTDVFTKYNDKWADQQRRIPNQTAGSVHTGHFARGQGGIFSTVSRPYNIDTAADIFIESENRSALLDLGSRDRWQLEKSKNR